jgi:adenine phosphoribosyltransferase
MELDRHLREIPHFPINGILFKDISPMLARRGALADAVTAIEPLVAVLNVEAVLAVDARGFVLGAALVLRVGSTMPPSRSSTTLTASGVPWLLTMYSRRIELPCGTTMVTAMPAREPAKASDWP